MSESKIVQIRKKGGLGNIIKDNKSKARLTPMLYSSKSKNKEEEGSLEGEYKGRSILDTKHFVSPMWNDLSNSWSFSGTHLDLSRLINDMKLRYPKNHEKSGQLIKSSESDVNRLTNRSDEVFNHPDFYGKYYMESGRISLDLSRPKQEFLYLCYKGDSSVQDKSSDKPVSKYVAAGAKYELVSPKKENQSKKRIADKDIKAIKLLASMDNDEDKMRAVCKIMQLPQYSPTSDLAGVFVLLKDMAAENKTFSSKYDKSYQDRFIELCSLSDEDLSIQSDIIEAKNKGILRRRKGFYLFNGEKLEGLLDDKHLISYFTDPKNQEEYLKLNDLLQNFK